MDDKVTWEALHALEVWNWQRPNAIEPADFDRAIQACLPVLSDADVETADRTSTALRSLYERSNHRLGVFLPEFGKGLRTTDKSQQRALLEQAMIWSENKHERLILDRCFKQIMSDEAAGLYDEHLSIDDLIEMVATAHWQKVAMVVGRIMGIRPGFVDEALAERVRALVDRGVLEAQGDLSNMRHSEVRLANS
ncbi:MULTISPECIES: DUF3658 domain-containing protein [Methylobacterium]|uniref:DUF3658 domain-containing protein n=1 Tax=Methylobacterium thuringiense TaxID=1003091 RepID=A0ABQ4TNF4_9HYPH|nr:MULTISPECIES: DUF3658 domain-containing protein [Methylobacterium]TXN23712.1 hypothetical protein FV217_05840 [Methylobacterium sp. WL9]GJE56142.1 hypothetical protein EKPJFOCH_2641 [Methylobacterium thuringiense]